MSRKELSGAHLLKDTISSDDLLGKEVFDSTGALTGIIDIVHLDPKKLAFVGISIDEGFLKRGLTVGKDYIARIAAGAVFLTIRPVFVVRGMRVFDSAGRSVGKVKDVRLVESKNIIHELVVSRGWFRSITIPGTFVKRVGENVFLSVSRDELQAFLVTATQSRRDQ